MTCFVTRGVSCLITCNTDFIVFSWIRVRLTMTLCVCVWQSKDEAVYIPQQHDQLRDRLVLQDQSGAASWPSRPRTTGILLPPVQSSSLWQVTACIILHKESTEAHHCLLWVSLHGWSSKCMLHWTNIHNSFVAISTSCQVAYTASQLADNKVKSPSS